MPEAELITLLGELRFKDAKITHRFNAFAGTSKQAITDRFEVIGVNVFARKD